MIDIGRVVSIIDDSDGERIKVRLIASVTSDISYTDNDLVYAYPVLPKMLFIKPKVGEAVFIFTLDDNENSQRLYIGPIISQPQFMLKNLYDGGATNLLRGGKLSPERGIKDEVPGAFAKDDDVAIYGRKNSDIVLSDDDLRIRCGVRLYDNGEIKFNTKNPSFIKLKYYEEPLHCKDNITKEDVSVHSTATIVGDKISLISTNGNPNVKLNDINESISDESMIKLIEDAHALPYGDKLVEFLVDFIKVFMSHTHNYNNMTPVEDSEFNLFRMKHGIDKKTVADRLLSKNININ